MSLPSLFFRLSALGCLVCLVLLAGCTDAYLPDVIKAPPSLLVVDGTINPQGVTTLKLSRTYAIASALAPPVEAKATAFVEEENGARYALREAPLGTYASAALALDPAKKYRVHLTTAAGKEYASAYVPVKLTPPVDAITWNFDNSQFNINVSAHDAANNTRYYRWDYEETWEIRPSYNTTLQYVNHVIVFRPVPFPRVCWGSDVSRAIQIDKTTAQSQDVVAEHRLRILPANTERLFTRYSILVQQHALTKEEYAYWELLRQNTESIGSLFDPQPAQLTGNVRCLSSPDELALGFVGAHSTTEKRIFVARADLPAGASILFGYEKCIPPVYIDLYPPPPADPPSVIIENAFGVNGNGYLPVGDVLDPNGKVIAYYAAVPDCLDCRLRGTSIKPSYWP